MLRSSGLLQGLVTQRAYIIVHPTPAWASLSALHSLVINHGWDMKHAPCNHVIRRPKHPASFALKVWLRTLTDACQIRLAGWYGTRCRIHVPAYYMRHKTSANRMGSIPATSAGSTDSLHLYTPSQIRCPGTLTL